MRTTLFFAGAFAWTALTLGASGDPPEPKDDYWVEPMREVHGRFTGRRGTVAQFGDSNTVPLAFFAPLQEEIKNLTPELKEAHSWLRKYVHRPCWKDWRGADYGNESGTTTRWALENMNHWLQKLKPETALVMWGTNDAGLGLAPAEYAENMRRIVQKCLDHGTVPILYTIPPTGYQVGHPQQTRRLESFVAAVRTVAREKKVPLIDYYREMITRQPTRFAEVLLDDWLHLSDPEKYRQDFSEEALNHSGHMLRNWLTLKKYYELYRQVFARTEPGRPGNREENNARTPRPPVGAGQPKTREE